MSVWRWKQEAGPAPWPIVLYNRCRLYGGLPNAGGVLDQDEQVMNLINWCLIVQGWHTDSGDAKKIAKWTPDVFEYVGWLRQRVREVQRGD